MRAAGIPRSFKSSFLWLMRICQGVLHAPDRDPLRPSGASRRKIQDLSSDDRRNALEVVERTSSHKAHLLEKDVWVVSTLGVLFDAPFAGHLTLKDGTSLLKMWHAIRRGRGEGE